jgi:hypothetical protein
MRRRRPMSATTQLPDGYSPSICDAIEQAFDAVWATTSMAPKNNTQELQELMISIRRTLIALAAEGITDPQELRRRTLESIALSVR